MIDIEKSSYEEYYNYQKQRYILPINVPPLRG